MRLINCLLVISLFSACTHGPVKPDTSKIKVNLTTIRFDQALFSIDSSQLPNELPILLQKNPLFGSIFMYEMLGAEPRWPQDTLTSYVGTFVHAYASVYDTAHQIFNDFSPYTSEVEEGMKLFQYYFPKYKLPDTLITYIGPADGYGDGWAGRALLVGLQHHIGKDYSLYKDPYFIQTYPKYLSDRFEPTTISVNCMKNLINDLYPEEELTDKKLLVQMVEKGKRLYLLSRLLPDKPEHYLIGYSEEQMKECMDHEKAIWALFTENNYLQSIDINVIKNYVAEGPKTQELGENAPGNIGSFAGWQIVKKYMEKNPELSLEKLMAADEEQIFDQAKYKP